VGLVTVPSSEEVAVYSSFAGQAWPSSLSSGGPGDPSSPPDQADSPASGDGGLLPSTSTAWATTAFWGSGGCAPAVLGCSEPEECWEYCPPAGPAVSGVAARCSCWACSCLEYCCCSLSWHGWWLFRWRVKPDGVLKGFIHPGHRLFMFLIVALLAGSRWLVACTANGKAVY
jgi:hypothetical protein